MCRRNYNCQCEKELGVKLRDAELRDTEMRIKISMPFILPYIAYDVMAFTFHMYSQMCVYILLICLHICMYDCRLDNFSKDVLPFRSVYF